MRYFTGDHPATQFEQGTSMGGHYKCGVCGTHESLFNDQAHTLQHKWRSVQELQTVATNGRYGKTPMALTPFKLRIKELRSELEARGFFVHDKMLRPELESLLKEILKGVARVPVLRSAPVFFSLLRQATISLMHFDLASPTGRI